MFFVNKTRRRLAPVIVALFVGLVTSGSAPALGAKKNLTHLADARLLVEHLRPHDNSYRHSPSVVRWKGDDGAKKYEAHTDCSGFIDALLQHSYGYSDDDFAKWFGSKRPTAARYFEQIKKQHGFQRIRLIQDVRSGDFLAVKYPPGSGNTGHIMLVNGRPRPMKATKPLEAGRR